MTTGFGTVEPTFFEKHKMWIGAAGGAAAFLVLALLVRSCSDDKKMVAKPDADERRAVVRDDTTGESDDSSSEASFDPQPSDSDNPPTVTPDVQPRRDPPRNEPPPVRKPSEVNRFRGKWKLLTSRMLPESVIPGLTVTKMMIAQTVNAAFNGPDTVSTLEIDEYGGYVLNIDVVGEGEYTANIKEDRNHLSIAADGIVTLTPRGSVVTDRARAMLQPVNFDIPHETAKAGDMRLSMMPTDGSGGAPATWFRPDSLGQPDSTILGTWSYDRVYVDSYLPYRSTIEFKENGNYRIRFTRQEQGMLVAVDGEYEFKRAIAMGPPVRGEYTFDGPDRFTIVEPRGTATWVRDNGGESTENAGRNRPRVRQ